MKIVVVILLLLLGHLSHSQDNIVEWNFSSKKISNKEFEVHMTAVIKNDWHLFSQKQPSNAIALPTSIRYSKNPLLHVVGKTEEVGKMQKDSNESLGIEQWQYINKVDFVQVIALKSKMLKLKTSITGTIEYQTCSKDKCLPSKTISFTIALK